MLNYRNYKDQNKKYNHKTNVTHTMEIDHSSHPHRLVLKLAQGPYACYGCKEPGLGTCYQCKYENCNFYIHEECAFPSPSAFHRLFKKCDLKFYEKAPTNYGRVRYCDACGKNVLGFSYQCTHKNAHDLHPCCLKLKHLIEGDEGVRLSLSDEVNSRCLYCNSKEIARGVKGWSYVSSCGNYCYHVACVKEIAYENWKKGKFSGISGEMNSLWLPNQGMVPRRNGSWSGIAYWKMAKTILKLIISAIFGDPLSLIAVVVEGLNA